MLDESKILLWMDRPCCTPNKKAQVIILHVSFVNTRPHELRCQQNHLFHHLACGSNTRLVGLRDVDLGPITTGDTTNLIIGEPVTSGDTCLFPTIGGLSRFASLCLLISARLFNGELVGDFC